MVPEMVKRRGQVESGAYFLIIFTLFKPVAQRPTHHSSLMETLHFKALLGSLHYSSKLLVLLSMTSRLHAYVLLRPLFSRA